MIMMATVSVLFLALCVWSVISGRRWRASLTRAQRDAMDDHMWHDGKWLTHSEWEKLGIKAEDSKD